MRDFQPRQEEISTLLVDPHAYYSAVNYVCGVNA